VAALVLLLVSGGAEAQSPGGWHMYGNDPARSSMTEASLRPTSLRPAWYTPVAGRISSQALVAQDVPAPGQRTVYVATSKGVVYALGENGYIRWRVELGQLDRICQQIDGYGVTGTGVIDPATRALYVADGFGRLHALDLVTGVERVGWPVQLYTDHRRELVWGAMTLVNGSIYVGTGSYCDRPMVGKVIRVNLATKQISHWVSVPLRLGGGGSVWGWGGVAYSPQRGSIFVATGNAFRGGSNVGKRFKESAGYGEHLVELSPELTVRAAHHPPEMRGRDIGFAGSPVIFRHAFCGDLVAAVNKDGFIYVWRATRVAAGTLFRLSLSSPTVATPLLSQPAYSPRTGAVYVATPGRLVRVDVTRRCKGRVTWGKKVGNGLFNGSPTIAGGIVWLAENANRGTSLLGFDARSGARRYRSWLGGPTYVAPTVVGDRLYVGTYTGGVQGFALPSGLQRPVGGGESPLPEHRSFSDALNGWASREDGVYATENGGASWRLLYPRSAIRVARVSALTGMLSLGDRALDCACRQRRIWTQDGGVSWRPTSAAVGTGFTGSAGTLWWWRGGSLFRAAHWPPGAAGLRGVRVGRLRGAIVDARAMPGGVVALVSNRVAGLGFDNRPRLLLVQRRRKARVLRLPSVAGEILARSVEVAWPVITVRGYDGVAFTRREEGTIEWRTIDGGGKWTVFRR
jgi:PQQ-like domain